MIKYVKWFLLSLLIISLVITIFMYLDYEKEKKEEIKPQIVEDELKILYNKEWFKSGVAFYEDDKLISENLDMINVNYIVLTDAKIDFCNSITMECTTYDYQYSNGKITINSQEEFILGGTYDINYSEEKMELIYTEGQSRYIHYFDTPKG